MSAPAPEEWLIELAGETARQLARRADAGRLARVNERLEERGEGAEEAKS